MARRQGNLRIQVGPTSVTWLKPISRIPIRKLTMMMPNTTVTAMMRAAPTRTACVGYAPWPAAAGRVHRQHRPGLEPEATSGSPVPVATAARRGFGPPRGATSGSPVPVATAARRWIRSHQRGPHLDLRCPLPRRLAAGLVTPAGGHIWVSGARCHGGSPLDSVTTGQVTVRHTQLRRGAFAATRPGRADGGDGAALRREYRVGSSGLSWSGQERLVRRHEPNLVRSDRLTGSAASTCSLLMAT